MAEQTEAISHESFFATVLTETGRVRPVAEGNDGARQVEFSHGIKALLKPALFGTEGAHGIAECSRYRREAAVYQYDRQLLGWGVVPPTTLTVWKNRPASIMAWVPGVPARVLAPKLFESGVTPADRAGQAALLAAKVNTDALRKVVLLDLLVNNTDRHGRNVLFDTVGNRVWAIDHGQCFGRFMDGYYEVFHRLLWPRRLVLTGDERRQLEGLTLADFTVALGRYLDPPDITMAHMRVAWVLAQEDLGFESLTAGGRKLTAWRAWFVRQAEQVVPSESHAHAARVGANCLTPHAPPG